MIEEVAKHQEVIRRYLTDELKKSKSPLVKQLVDGFETTLKYRLDISVDK